MWNEITTLRVDVDQLRSICISILWGKVSLPEMPKSMPTSESRVQVPSSVVEKPSVGCKIFDDIEHVERAVDETSVDSTEETDEDEFLWEDKCLIELKNLEETIVLAMMERSCVETSSVGTSGVSLDSTIP